MAGRKKTGDAGSELALFLDMLMAERGAAAHTIGAYRRDLAEFLALLAAKRKDARNASADDVREFLAKLKRKGLAPTSRARKLSALRQFFRFLLAEGLRQDDPSSAIDSPKLPRPLPKILSLAEVETLLGGPGDPGGDLGLAEGSGGAAAAGVGGDLDSYSRARSTDKVYKWGNDSRWITVTFRDGKVTGGTFKMEQGLK